MGICYRPEVPGSRVIAGNAMWRENPADQPADLHADCNEPVATEWKVAQPRLSLDARQRILALYDEYRPRLYRYLRSMNLGRDWAEEVIQETFMRLTAELLKKDNIENVQGWVVRVAHNLAVDVLKKESGAIGSNETASYLIENHVDPSLSPEETYWRIEQSNQMNLALSTLKPQHRLCFQMRAHGFRYKDIGLALGISEQRAAFVVKQVAVRLAALCG